MRGQRQFIAVGLLLFVACAPRAIMLDRAVVRNETGRLVSDLHVRHEPTQAIGKASRILPRAEFDLGFSRQPLRGKSAVVSWTTELGVARRVNVDLPREAIGTNTDTYTLVYTIFPDGTVSVRLEL